MSTKKQQTSDGYMMTKKAYTTTKKIKPMKKETMPKTKEKVIIIFIELNIVKFKFY